MRKAVWNCLDIPYGKQQAKRAEKKKPYFSFVNDQKSIDIRGFNVSHSGDFAVLAADFSQPDINIGVDVMKVEWPSRTVPGYFHTMRRQFAPLEWEVIKKPPDEWEQMHAFYRFWCLKESFAKAIGVGLGISMKTLEFHIDETSIPTTDEVICTTKLFIDGIVQNDWIFEESYIDSEHRISVAIQVNDPTQHKLDRFVELTLEDLLKDVPEVDTPDLEYWHQFAAKEERPKRQSKAAS